MSTGTISTVVGNGTKGFAGDGGPAIGAELSTPEGLALDSLGNLYIADLGNGRIRMVSKASGTITTVAGNGTATYGGDGGAATSASFNPQDVATDAAGNLYISDNFNNRIRRVQEGTGVISRIAGSGVAGQSGDGGAATSARINGPRGLRVDAAGNVYFADQHNALVRKVTLSTGLITTVAGGGGGSGGTSDDGGPATSALLSSPNGVEIDSAGNCSSPTLAVVSYARLTRLPASSLPSLAAAPAPQTALLPRRQLFRVPLILHWTTPAIYFSRSSSRAISCESSVR